jgi:hypothetical protein
MWFSYGRDDNGNKRVFGKSENQFEALEITKIARRGNPGWKIKTITQREMETKIARIIPGLNITIGA